MVSKYTNEDKLRFPYKYTADPRMAPQIKNYGRLPHWKASRGSGGPGFVSRILPHLVVFLQCQEASISRCPRLIAGIKSCCDAVAGPALCCSHYVVMPTYPHISWVQSCISGIEHLSCRLQSSGVHVTSVAALHVWTMGPGGWIRAVIGGGRGL